MKIIKVILLLLMIPVLLSSTTVSAADAPVITIRADGSVRANRSFDVYIDYSYSDGIGAGRSYIDYDSDLLVFKRAVLENKSANEFFHYTDDDGRIKLTFSCAGSTRSFLSVRLHFAPTGTDADSFAFNMVMNELCDLNGKMQTAKDLPACTVKVFENGNTETSRSSKHEASSSVSRTSESTQERSSRSSRSSKASVTSSAASSGVSGRSASRSDSESDRASDSNSEEHIVYYVHDNDSSFRLSKRVVISLIGFACVCFISIVFAYKTGKKRRQDEDRGKKERSDNTVPEKDESIGQDVNDDNGSSGTGDEP